MKNFIGFGIFLIIFGLSCLPERDNPYDPKSPHHNYSQIVGRILTKDSKPIADAQVTLLFTNISKVIATYSDANGNYELEYFYALEQGDSAIVSAVKNNYAENKKSVSLGIRKSDTVNFMLDALPQFSAESVFSNHEQYLYPGDVFSANFRVAITDADGLNDIDSVLLVMPSLVTSFYLSEPIGNIYRKTVYAESLPGGTLETLIGTDCYFEVVSKSQLRTRSKALRLTRIIYEAPEPIAPFEDTVDQNFYCSWNSVNFTFPFTYGVEVYCLTENWQIVRAFATDTISPDITSIQIPITLPVARAYYWRALVKDNFGNIAKSIPCEFYLRRKKP